MKIGKVFILMVVTIFVGARGVIAAEPVWQRLEGSDMPESIGSYYGVAYDEGHDRVFVVGGYSSSTAHVGTTGVYEGQFGSDGRISWRKISNYPRNILGNFSYFDSVRNRLVVVGGDSAGAVLDEVKSLEIEAISGNSVGGWVSETPLPTKMHFSGGLVYGGKVFIFGGRDSNGVGKDTIYWRTYGTSGAWSLSTRRMPYWGDSMAVAVNNGFIYVGGAQAENKSISSCTVEKVYYAPISDNGDIGSWNRTTDYIKTEHWYLDPNDRIRKVSDQKAYHMMKAVGGYLYVGPANTGNDIYVVSPESACRYPQPNNEYLNSTMRTFRAPILANGSLGSWEMFGNGSDPWQIDSDNWHKDKFTSNVYGWVARGSKIYQVGGMNYAGVSKAVYSLDLSGQGVVAVTNTPIPTQTPTPTAGVIPLACSSSSGSGELAPGGVINMTMTANQAVDSGELHVYNQENLVSGVPQIVKFGGVPVSITNGIKSADGKTVSFQIRYEDLVQPDSNYSNTYLSQVQFNGIFRKGTMSSNYNGNCVKSVQMSPRPGSVSPTPVPANGAIICPAGVPAKTVGNANCDGVVNVVDFEVWYGEYQKYRSGQTQAGGWKADFNGDGRVDSTDLAIFRAEWGR